MAEAAEKRFSRLEGQGVGGESRRNIRHISPNKPKLVNNVPSRESGQNGDIVYYQDPRNLNKVFQYVKLNNRWINLSDGRPTEDSARTKKFVKARTE
jgi:signal peptidase I